MPETTEPKRQPESNVKETVESILVAFILAFIFRAFVVEAFVIPTGSMAPTLYGAHMRFRCPDCGTVFDVGYSASRQRGSEEPDIPSDARRATDFHCPNCGYRFNRDQVQRVRFGDRILVLKYLYLFEKPQRGDTVVFKSPNELGPDPKDPEYSVNYIKRLVGIGPETVVLLDGDVYTGPLNSRNPAEFKIWRKPAHVQEVLWRSIYDNDFIPHLADDERVRDHRWTQPWEPQGASSGWDTGVGGRSRIFRFSGSSAGEIAFDSSLNPETHALSDYLVYDEVEHHGGWDAIPVSDLKLACTYTRHSGNGALRLQLTKLRDCFTVQLTPGKVTLLRATLSKPGSFDADSEKTLTEKSLPELAGPSPVRVELMNVDYRVSVRINGNEVIAYEYDPDVVTLWNNAMNPPADPDPFAHPQVRLTAADQQCSVEHVQLSRDIYYLNHVANRSDSQIWGNPRRAADLKAGEFFTLGDNSFISGDGRYWSDPIELPKEGMPHVESGRVPEQFMLGKAFFVYWPAGYSVPSTGVNIVPDFGDMRFIH
jgi:signal peptidase I